MRTRNIIISTIAALLFAVSGAVLACGGEASGKHFGQVTSVDPAKSTFTIRDAETRAPITFAANQAILSKAKSAQGSVIVNYEENEDGGLQAMRISL